MFVPFADYNPNPLFLNNSDGTFSEVTAASGTGLDANGIGDAAGDFDGDGRLDWYVTSVYGELRETVAGTGNMLYLNLGAHRFTESAAATAIHDGRLDIVTTNGWRSPTAPASRIASTSSTLTRSTTTPTSPSPRSPPPGRPTTPARGAARCTSSTTTTPDQDLSILTKADRIRRFRNDLAAPDRH